MKRSRTRADRATARDMKLYRFRYSPFARKVQMLLDLLADPYELVEVPYGDRNQLAELTGGYIQVPVLLTGAGRVITESRAICEHLLAGAAETRVGSGPPPGTHFGGSGFSH